MISQAFDQLMAELHQHLNETGQTDVRPNQCLNVFRFMDCDSPRPTMLPDRWCHTAEITTRFFADMETRWGALGGPDRLQDVESALTEILGAPFDGAVIAKPQHHDPVARNARRLLGPASTDL